MAATKGKDVASSRKKGLDSSVRKSLAVASSSTAKRKKPMPTSQDGGASSEKKRRSSVLKFVDDAALEENDSEFSFSYSGDDDDDNDDDDFESEPEAGCSKGMKGTMNSNETDGRTSARTRNVPFFLKEEALSGDELEDMVRRRYNHHSELVQDDCKPHNEGSSIYPIQDPKIWRVKCMVGRERHIAFCFFQKFVDLHSMGTKLPVLSIFSVDNIKGCVFIEAQKESDVLEACNGFCNLYSSRISEVAKNEMPRLLSAKTSNTGLAKGTWVRVRNGNYKGDLAQIAAYDNCSQRALVKLVPRINLQALAKKFGGGESLSQVAIPPRRLLSPHELEIFRPHIQVKRNRLTGENFEVLDGLMIKDGYLYKKVSMASLSCLAVEPSRLEREQFESVKEDVDMESNWLSAMFDRKRKTGESGDVSDDAKANDYKLHDLILFGQKSFGVIIGIKCDSFQVLPGGTEAAPVVTVQRKDIKNSCSDKMFAASDCNKNTITINDKVKVVDGLFKDKQGTVRHMYKGSLFIYDEKQSENCGFFCAIAHTCENLKSFQKENMLNRSNHINVREPCEFNEDTGSRRFRRLDTDSRFLVGQTLRIRVGPLKGYLCRVVSVRRSTVTVKLDSQGKIITVNYDHLSEAGAKNFGSVQNSAISDNGASDIPSDSGWGQLSTKMPLDTDFTISSCGWNTTTIALDQSNTNNISDKDVDADPWGSKLRPHGDQTGHVAPDNHGETSCWEKSSVFWNAGTCPSTKGSDVWEQAKPANQENAGTWEKETTKSDNMVGGDVQPNTWDLKGKAPMNNEAPVWGKTSSSNWEQNSSFPSEEPDNCDSRKKGVISNEEDVWTKATSSQNIKDVEPADAWCGQSKLSASRGDVWASRNAGTQKHLASDDWLKERRNLSSVEGDLEQNISKDLNDQTSNWNATSQSGADKAGSWGKAGVSDDKKACNHGADNWDNKISDNNNDGGNEMRNGSWNTENTKSTCTATWSAKGNPPERDKSVGLGKHSLNLTDEGDSLKHSKGSRFSSWSSAENESDAWVKSRTGKWNNASGNSSWSHVKNGPDVEADSNAAIESDKWARAVSRSIKNGDNMENWNKGGSHWQNSDIRSGTSDTNVKSVNAIKADEWNTAMPKGEDTGCSEKMNNTSCDSDVSKAVDHKDSDPWVKVASKDKIVSGNSPSCQGWGGSSWGNTTTPNGKQLETTKDVWSQATNNQTPPNEWDKQISISNDQSGNWQEANDKSVLGCFKGCSGSVADASDPWSQPPSICGSQENSWRKSQETTRAGSESWNNNAGEFAANTGGLGGTNNWSIPESSDTDWKKGASTRDANRGNWGSNSDTARDCDRSQDFGRCSGNRGRRNNWQGEHQNSWGNESKVGCSQQRRFDSCGGRDRGQNWESGGGGPARGQCQSDWSRGFGNSGGGRGRGLDWESGSGRGSGQVRSQFQSSDWGNRQNRNSSGNSDPDTCFGNSAGGRGRGLDWESGSGRGRGQGRGRFQSSDWSNRENWNSSGNSDPDTWSKGKSFGGTETAGENNSRRDWNSDQVVRSWNCATNSGGGNQCVWTQGSTPSDVQAGDGWNSSKHSEKQSCWANDAPSCWSDRRGSDQDCKKAGDQSWNSNDRSSSHGTRSSGWELKSTNDSEIVTECTPGNESQQKYGWDSWASAADKQHVTGGTSYWEKSSKGASGWSDP